MAILVDTGAVELLRRQDRRAETWTLQHYPPIICSHIVGEFLFGQANAEVSAATFQEARAYLESFEILQPTLATGAIYARVRADLEKRGIQLPDPDLWIAAHALEERVPLLSTDKDFRHIPEVTLKYLPPLEKR